jgi:general secretion pathway protein L
MTSSPGAFWSRELFEGSLGAAAARFWSWYKQEFLALFPQKTVAWLLDRGDRKLILHNTHGVSALECADDGQGALMAPILADEVLASSLDEALARRGMARESTQIILEIDSNAFFVRRFDIPVAAQPNLPRLLAAEIERKTPFRAADVLHGHVSAASPDNPEKLAIEQWILRRDLLERALEGSGVAPQDLDVVRPFWPADAQTPGPAPRIAVGGRAEASNWFRAAAILLVSLAAVLFLAGLGLTLWRQERIGAELDAKVAEVSSRASRVRQIADRAAAESRLLATLRRERERIPMLADLWEEVSRLLPDGAYVTELRLSEMRDGERIVDLVGYSDQAVGLPALFDRTPLFSDAALTAPITPDANEKREGFSLQAKVKQKRMAKGAKEAKKE